MIITSLRTYHDKKTTARVFVDGEYFEESLEDPGRPQGVKIQGETAIPEGAYRVAITDSPTFKKPMMVLYNYEPRHLIRRDDIEFSGIRVHAGTDTSHTEGCILLKNYFVLQSEVQKALDRGDEVLWVITKAV